MNNQYRIARVTAILTGVLLTASGVQASTIQEWLFFVEAAPGSYHLHPFAITQHARIRLYIEWSFPNDTLEIALYPPDTSQPIRHVLAQSPVEWELTTMDAHPWKGLWRLIVRNSGAVRGSRGRVRLDLDYTFKPSTELETPSEPAEDKQSPPTAQEPRWGLVRSEMKWSEETRDGTLLTFARFPDSSNLPRIRIRLEEKSLTFETEGLFHPLEEPTYSAEVPHIPILLGVHCWTMELVQKPLPPSWTHSIKQCFHVHCVPQTIIEPTEPPSGTAAMRNPDSSFSCVQFDRVSKAVN